LNALWQQQLRTPIESQIEAAAVRSLYAPKAVGRWDMMDPDWIAAPKRQEPGPLMPFRTFRDLLRDDHPSEYELILVKVFAKALLDCSDSALPREIATGLYYGAIAAALVHLRRRITPQAKRPLIHGLRWCLNQPWFDTPTRELFHQALTRVIHDS
jgi:hypothetical protein